MLDFDNNSRTADYNVIHESYQNDTRVTRCDRKRNEDLCRQSNILPIVQVINKNKLRWFGHGMGKEKESKLGVVMKLKMTGKRPRGTPGLRTKMA